MRERPSSDRPLVVAESVNDVHVNREVDLASGDAESVTHTCKCVRGQSETVRFHEIEADATQSVRGRDEFVRRVRDGRVVVEPVNDRKFRVGIVSVGEVFAQSERTRERKQFNDGVGVVRDCRVRGCWISVHTVS